jgi:putative ABC transport system permease protein
MGRLAWSQLRFRASRALALLLGMLLAATAFTVLTAASRTSQLRTVGTVLANFRPAYDILVRPRRSRTALEVSTGAVQPNFLSGIYGGITMAQYHEIQAIAGVQIAAPIAMVGYTLPLALITVRLPAALVARPGRQLYRFSTTWVSGGGKIRIVQPPSYVYITPNPILGVTGTSTVNEYETQPGRPNVAICPSQMGGVTDPFGIAGQSDAWCWSKVNGLGSGPGGETFEDLSAAHPGGSVTWLFPMLIAAIDPEAEAKLDGLNQAVTSGHYLTENAGSQASAGTGPPIANFPVLAAAETGIGEYSLTKVQDLPAPAGPATLTVPWMEREAAVPGKTMLTTRIAAEQAYQNLLQQMSVRVQSVSVEDLWSVGPTTYRRDSAGALAPVIVDNPVSVWESIWGPPYATVDNEATQYRAVASHAPASGGYSGGVPVPILTGTFDPARIRAFDLLSQVPLGPYQPVSAAPADARSRQALGGHDLLPNTNLGGYVSQPVDLVTTLKALPALENSGLFNGNLHAGDPISVIRVRVAGVTGPNPASLERIREVAQLIVQGTGLTVDIVAGSSPAPTRIGLPAGKFGQPRLELTEGWVRKGVAVAILTAVDKKSVVLFTLILVVCGLFVANSATAAARGRRREMGVLAGLGWTRPRLFATVLGELAVIGLIAGIIGAAAALPLSAALSLRASQGRALLAVPVAVAVAVLAGAVPAWLAARAEPVVSVRPPVVSIRRGHHPGGITALAVVNVLRTPGRTLIGALSLAVGVAALTLLTAMTVAFHGVVVGSLLGDTVAVQVRGVDYIAVGATVALGVLAVVDVVFLNIRERAAELATIRTFGWREAAQARLVVTEGTLIGLAGSVVGGAAGLAAAVAFAGQMPARLVGTAAAAVAAGVLVTAAAAVVPAQLLRRLPLARLLAEE